MFSRWCSSWRRKTLEFHVMTTVILLSLFLIVPIHSDGKFVAMYPNESDQVLEGGATLNLTCIIDGLDGNIKRNRYNVSWTLPEHLVKNHVVRNMFIS